MRDLNFHQFDMQLGIFCAIDVKNNNSQKQINVVPRRTMNTNGETELILCFTICVHSATRHNVHMYPYFLFAAIHHLDRPDFLCPTS